MVDILTHLHKYVPYKEFTREVPIPSLVEAVPEETATVCKTLFGGDQLTAARARGAITAMSNATTTAKRLKGLIPVIEDWHAQVSLLDVSKSVAVVYLMHTSMQTTSSLPQTSNTLYVCILFTQCRLYGSISIT